MAIQYNLRPNPLVTDTQSFAATVVTAGSAGLDQIADRIVDQGTTIRRADVLAVLENAFEAADALLKDGFRVQLGGLCDLFPRIKGSFQGPTDTFDPARHQVDIAAMPGRRLRKSFRAAASVRRLEAAIPAPSPVHLSQQPAGPEADKIIPQAIGTLDGWHLKFNPAMEDEGIFLVNVDTGEVVRVSTVQKNRPRQLVFLIPTVAPDCRYQLEVRARHRGGTQLRTGKLDGRLTA